MRRKGRRLGDERVRVEVVRAAEFRVTPARPVRRSPAPALVIIVGFAGLIAAGTFLLALPISSAGGDWTRPVDALFTATSAVCVTGLVVLDTGTYWSPMGQVVILLLIQAGGFGFMTTSTLLLLILVRRRTSLRDRILVQASTGEPSLGGITSVLRRVAVFTIAVEAAGSVALGVAFVVGGRDVLTAGWWGLFHAVSAFNNAGFDVIGGFASLTEFANQPLVLAMVAVLIVLGGLGYAILGDVVGKRSWVRLALETKVVLLGTAILITAGTAVIATLEWTNPATLGPLSPADRFTNSMFMSVTARTAGFNALSIGDLLVPSLMVTIALMAVGGASGSTAGGIKINTLAVLVIAIRSTFLGRPSAEAFGRRISHVLVYRSVAVALFWIAALVAFTVSLLAVTDVAGIAALFETASALATVGLTTGITPELPDSARLLLVPAMFVGRLGPLTIVLALAARSRPVRSRPAIEMVRLG